MKKGILYLLFSIAILFGGNLVFGQETEKSTKSDPNVPIFEIKNDQGQTVFAVYPGGVKIFIDEQLKAAGGGFTVGRLSTGKATNEDYFMVNPGDVKVFLPESQAKAAGGGFTVGRLSTGKKAAGDEINFMKVTPDSTRIYTVEESNKGFAVGKLNIETGVENFLDLTPENYFIGHESGRLTTGTYNLFFGYRAGYNNTSGERNFFAGYGSGLNNTLGNYNVFIGPESGTNNIYGIRNIFVGYRAGFANVGDENSSTIGHDNIYIGTRAGEANATGEHNTLIGSYSGYTSDGTKNTFVGAFTGFDASGIANVFLGVDAGRNNTAGNNNTFLGTIAGNSNSGSNNTFVGYGSGYYNYSGSGNVLVGYLAGPSSVNNFSNQLYINNGTGTPLIWGDFANNRVVINGTNPNGYNFFVNGTSAGTSSFAVFSDMRLKTNIITIPSALNKVLQLRGVSYEWKDQNAFDAYIHIGFLAQEVEEVIPEVVSNINDNYTMQYAPITALIVEAMKEQQTQIENLKQENEKLKEQISEIEKLKQDIEALKRVSNKLSEKVLMSEN